VPHDGHATDVERIQHGDEVAGVSGEPRGSAKVVAAPATTEVGRDEPRERQAFGDGGP
jgi:hypothetical protein